MEAIRGIVKGLALVARVKNMVDAIDDDINQDGLPEIENLKNALLEALEIGKTLLAKLKSAFEIAMRIVNHIAKNQ